MALNQERLQQGLEDAFVAVMYDTGDRMEAVKKLTSRLAEAIHNYNKDAEIRYESGLTAPAAGGPVTGEFIGGLK